MTQGDSSSDVGTCELVDLPTIDITAVYGQPQTESPCVCADLRGL